MNILGINPVSSADYLVKRFHEMQIHLIIITSNAATDEEKRQRYPHLDYTKLPAEKIIDITTLSESERLECIHAAHKQYHFSHGFSGAEGGLETAEKLLADLFPSASNDPKTSQYRFDKFWMNEILGQEHIPSIPQLSIDAHITRDKQIDLTKRFYETHEHDIIIKPRSGSAASVDVFKPSTYADIENYFNHEHNGTFYQSDFLLQKVIYGDEYYLDYASYADQHRLVAVGKIEKELTNGSFEYLYADNLSLENELTEELSRYALQCLKTLGVKNGFSHIEIKDTPKGLRLIELNPRLSGSDGYHNIMAKRRYDEDQIDGYIDLVKGYERQKIVSERPLFQRLVYFKNKKGPYNFINILPVKSLRTYVSHKIKVPSMLMEHEASATMLNIVMFVLLESENQVIIEEDFQRLMQYQKTNECLENLEK